MIIENLRVTDSEKGVRVTGMVIWEDCGRATQEIYFETEGRFAKDVSCNPHAFLVGGILPAMFLGEKRIFIDDEICPHLRGGLETVMSWFKKWYKGKYKPVCIEAGVSSKASYLNKASRAGLFLSGGIDSLAALRDNRLRYPLEHPGSVKDGLIVHGFDLGAYVGHDRQFDIFERAVKLMSKVADETGITLIPVYTNIRHLNDDLTFWNDVFFGACLSSVAHVFTPRLSQVYIASGLNIANMHYPHGSNPLLDVNYSSQDMRIEHQGVALSRLAKTKLVADWDVGLQSIRVCTLNPEEMVNCGKCEKCIRTMTALVALGALDKSSAFLETDVSSKLLSGVHIKNDYLAAFYSMLIDTLEQRGRHDLARTIKYIVAKKPICVLGNLLLDGLGRVRAERIKKFDEKYLGGCLAMVKRKLMG